MKNKNRGQAGRPENKNSKNSNSKKRSEGPRSRNDDSGSSKKPRKEIKNARGLADVLGMGAKSASGGSSRPGVKFNGPAPRNGGPSAQSSGGRSSNNPAGTASGKLQYIMNFQPPPGATAAVSRPSEARPTAARPTESRIGGNQAEVRNRMKARTEETRPTSVRPTPAPAAAKRRQAGSENNRIAEGIVKRHPDGFGFFIPDDKEIPDVYISRQSMSGIMTNDRVEVQIYKPRSFSKSKEDRLSGEVMQVLSRSNRRIVGRFLPVDTKYGVILDEHRGWGADLRISTQDSMDAKEGDLVAAEITQYPDDSHEFTGKVVSLIGDSNDPINDVIRIVHEASIPLEFSKQAIAQAKAYGPRVNDVDRKGREDLTELPLITIDGVTARDFDDAIFVEEDGKGFHLIVAIADVSHYVKPGTKLDEEAFERGTSTYFPNFVVPMLPEDLSNNLCSLMPKVPRLCFCCEMHIDFEGEIVDYRFFEGVMESKARVTYGEAQEIMDSKNDPDLRRKSQTVKKLQHVEENILRAADLARILMAKRFREGSLDLEIPETQVVVDTSGETTDIIRSERLFAHRLIEELMLVTNICTARFFDQEQIPGIYRVHESPDPDSIKSLQRYLWNLGGSRSVMGGNLAKKLTQALEAMKERPEAPILNILTLRTMQQARYSDDNAGHFGLGFSHYSHFTSPIRRYPDLIAHRLIKSRLYEKYSAMELSAEDIATATNWLSSCEQRSVKAERKVISIKKARFMKKFEGEEFEGIISSVAKFGIFVMLRTYDVDGLVKIENLGNDRFQYDEENLRLIGARSGLRYSIGDAVKVKVTGVDSDAGKIDFILAGEVPLGKSNENEKKRNNIQAQKRGKAEDDRRSVRKERVSKRRRKN
jgi:ribonuclease R